jgi:glucose 1-dehydrogenase
MQNEEGGGEATACFLILHSSFIIPHWRSEVRMSTRPVLQGQTAIVTGASSGIGRAIARAMAGAGARVIINYRSDAEEAEEVVREVREGGGRALAVRADVSEEEQVRAMFRRTVEAFGTVDILVANAGVQEDAAFAEMTLGQWQKVMAVNLTGSFLCAREAVREFRRRGPVAERSRAAGKIIFTSSVHEVIPWAGRVNYAASKGGVMLLMKSLAREVAAEKIRVNSIGPGAIKTAINRQEWETPEAEAALRKMIPYDRVGEPEDVASVAVWLASDEADYVTGTTIFVDGGMLLYPGFGGG